MRLSLTRARHDTPVRETPLQFLHQVSILQDLTPDQLAILLEMAKTCQFRAGTAIITEGETGDTMFLLTEGVVEITKPLTLETSRGEFSTKDKTLRRLQAEEHPFFGEMALLGTDRRSATVTAVTDCTALSLDRQDLLTLEQEHLEIAYAIVRRIAEVLCTRVHQENQNVLKLTTALSIALSR